MKCMMLEEFNAPLVLREHDLPMLEAREALIKVEACGVCRTDLKLCQGKHPECKKLPIIPGHEVAGQIVEVGRDVGKSCIGENVVVYTYLFCGECEFCSSGRENLCSHLKGIIGFSKDGGYADYLKAPVDNLFPITGDVSFERAAIIPDAIATSYHAISQAQVCPGEIIAVIGAGGLGIHALQIAKVFGARVIVLDHNQQALAIAREMGADKEVSTVSRHVREEISDFSGKRGVDVVIECSGDPGMQVLSIDILSIRGRFIAVGYNPDTPFQVNSRLLISKEARIYGSRSKSRDDLRKTIELVSSSMVKPFVGGTYRLGEANSVLSKLDRGDTVGRSVLVP